MNRAREWLRHFFRLAGREKGFFYSLNVENEGVARLYRAASGLSAGLGVPGQMATMSYFR
jgi:hypothetical protein